MTRGLAGSRLSAAVLIAGGAVALHELRYLVVYRDHSEEALAATGHHYLALITPLAAGLMVFALRPLLVALGKARPAPAGPAPRLASLWALATGCLLAIHAGQEWLEGVLTAQHAGGVEGVVGNGGWSALVLAAAIGALVAFALRGAQEALAVTVRRAPFPTLRPLCRAIPIPPLATPVALDAVACHLAGRGPPAP